MTSETVDLLSATWENICEQYNEADHAFTLQFIEQNLDEFVAAFYKQMLIEPESADYFTDNIIQQRLINTLKAWLLETFSVAIKGNYEEAVKRQQKVGIVHARIGIPSWLIMRGVREIERTFFKLIPQNEHEKYIVLGSYLVQLMGFSTEIMCRTYEDKTEKHHEVKHSYRLFSAMQDVAVHKDRQRGSLLDWENDLMFKIFSGQNKFFQQLFSKSEFGLWFIHKASYAFAGSEQVTLITKRIYEVDALTEECMSPKTKDELMLMVQQIRSINREIQNLVDQLFQVTEYIESGNDALTQLLNRRYLNTILGREIGYARKHKTSLSLLALDADYFKSVNDRFGHAAGDIALKFIAETLQKYTKGSDYAFRIGGEEFLLLLVDSDLSRAKNIAETIRECIEETTLQTAMGEYFNFTVSIGCTQYDGHPDYQRFLDATDLALYSAKNRGRNCVYVTEVQKMA